MNIIEELKNKFGEKVEFFPKSARRIYVEAAKADTKEIVKYIHVDLGARFSIATGIDTQTGVEILYHMAFDRGGGGGVGPDADRKTGAWKC